MSLNGILTIVAKDIKTGDFISEFEYIINENNVGDPQVELPEENRDSSLFPSLKPAASYSPVVASGESTPTSPAEVSLQEGKYLISVLAPGYKMGGNWIAVNPDDQITVEVKLQPNPLSLSKIRVHVFNDNNPVNGEDDVPLENGLEGFSIVISDALGEVTVDYFGNPIGTEYQYDSEGRLISVPGTGGKILTDTNGNALIDNLPPGKYGVLAIPPDGTDWVQTTTIEGTHVIDAWIEEGNDGYSPREGFKAPLVWVGFVKPMEFTDQMPWATGIIKGRVRTIIEFIPPFRPLTLGKPVDRPWIALSDIGRNDQQVYLGRGDENGNFTIENVPPGIYQMAIWDEPLDYIISFRTVQVSAGRTIDMQDIGIPRWYGYIKGTVFNDTNGNGVHDAGEIGIPNVEVVTRFKDGSIQYSTVTDMYGHYALKEVFQLERFAVAEVGFTRFASTGATATPDDGIQVPISTGCFDENRNHVRCSETYPPGTLTLAELTWAGKTNRIDWGKRPYGAGENGGISGIVYYATMRNEANPRFAMPEEYEPGIPEVIINLYATTEQDGRVVQGSLIATTNTDAWQHPTGCTDAEGQPIDCIEIPTASNQIREGVFDGGYAFDSLSSGTYIVEVEPPQGYEVLDVDGSVNTEDGDEFEIADSNHMIQMLPPSYYEDPEKNMYKKVVKVAEGMNAAADFYLYTRVPIPGRIVGFLLDDVNIETDPNFIYYGEKRGIPNAPVGIRDFAGKLITTVHSDVNGIFEVLLPSTYTRNIPTPSGVVPNMYQIIGNDPGDPDDPNERYNPNYQTLKMVFDVWPGKTTYADVALFPITAFVAAGGAQFSQPPICKLPDDIPQIFKVDRIHIDLDHLDDAERRLSISGTGFGTNQGKVTLNGIAINDNDILEWNNLEINVYFPQDFSAVQPGSNQLLVTNVSGKTSPTGITFHICRENDYCPNIITVSEGVAGYGTIQETIDNATDGSIIFVPPGIYYENPILYKNVKLQGVGPGGIRSDETVVEGSIIDGRFFLSYIDQWVNKLNSIDFDGAELDDQVKEISRGQVVTVVAKEGDFSNNFRPLIDGFTITGARGEDGGGLYVNAHCYYLIISNNIIQSNGGGFGGGITIGKSYVGDNYNDHIHIHHNRILNNGGISLAGGIGIFNGADYYCIEYNQICGNYSAEYGGGISHFGLSTGVQIHHNCIEFNSSFDEGAGVFIGGEQPTPPEILSKGSGEVDIYNNLIRGNLANDDGGGIRLLQPMDYRITIYNNMVVNNVSTDIGGGIALDDASNVVIVNNTIAKNITTATAEDSDGRPHGAGLISEMHSAAFQATLPPDSLNFSNPVLFNNIFWDNRAGMFDQSLNDGKGGIIGIGNQGEQPTVIDLEVYGSTALLNPKYCCLTPKLPPYAGGSNNIEANPMFIEENNVQLTAVAFNMEPNFKSVKIVTVEPLNLGDYHIIDVSPAIDQGINQLIEGAETFFAPDTDFDGESRPQNTGYDIGADEYSETL